jgi:glutaconate CoA-transferase subunit B
LGVYGFDDVTKKLKLVSIHPGVTKEQIKENSSFEIIIPDKVAISPEPTDEDLRILRKEIDPAGMVLGK